MKIEIAYGGVIAIIGKTPTGIIVQVTGLQTFGSIAHLINRFAKNCIEGRCLESGKDLLFFEYNTRGELRNPMKLLKSLRSKLMRASDIVYAEFQQEESDLDWQVSNAFHGRMQIAPRKRA